MHDAVQGGRVKRSSPISPFIRLPAGYFRPPHCPNRNCLFFEPSPEWEYTPWGFYDAPCSSHPLPRFRCSECGRTFTPRTFAVTYWLHRNDLFSLIARMAVGGSGVRQIARALRVSHSTVVRHLTRAGRHCLLFHRSLVEDVPLKEDLIIDGFESFEFSQFFPCHYNLAVGRESWFLYHFTDSPLRRKGTMTTEQRERRTKLEAQLGRPDPQAVRKGIEELLRVVLAPWRIRKGGGTIEALAPLTLHSDEHKAYPPAIRAVRRELGVNPTMLRHEQTPSTDPRIRANALFAVNLADLLLRHCGADHRRETIAYDKRIQGGLERAAIFAVWRNAIKWRRENHPGETAAMVAGILSRRIGWREVFARRLFPREPALPGRWWLYYWRQVKTAALGAHQTENRAGYAF